VKNNYRWIIQSTVINPEIIYVIKY